MFTLYVVKEEVRDFSVSRQVPSPINYAARRCSNATSLSFAFSVFVRLTENIRIASEPIYKQSNLCRPHQKHTLIRPRDSNPLGLKDVLHHKYVLLVEASGTAPECCLV